MNLQRRYQTVPMQKGGHAVEVPICIPTNNAKTPTANQCELRGSGESRKSGLSLTHVLPIGSMFDTQETGEGGYMLNLCYQAWSPATSETRLRV